jgi:hypothetical protein
MGRNPRGRPTRTVRMTCVAQLRWGMWTAHVAAHTARRAPAAPARAWRQGVERATWHGRSQATVGWSTERCPRGASMGHSMMARQGVGPGNGPRERDDVEAEAPRFRDGAAVAAYRWRTIGVGADKMLQLGGGMGVPFIHVRMERG